VLETRNDERRIVTVLFADLVGFTTLSEARDPERVKNLIDDCFSRLVADVTAFGGRVDKIVGDAIVALFGAPVAHEDDAERAVRAALQMQQTMCAFTDVKLRVGVNTGEVLVGALRAGGDYTAMGDVVNVASRLQSTAQPGTVVVGPATWAATREVVDYESLGPLQAKGREEPVEAWRAVVPLAPPGHRPRRSGTPLVGRDQELGVLCNSLDLALARRRAHMALLLGEAGVGKSRLAQELADVAADKQGALVLEGRCLPYGEANVWWPVADALRQVCAITPDDDATTIAAKCRSAAAGATRLDPAGSELGRIVDGLLYLMGDREALADVDPLRARDDARRSFLAVLEGLAASQPVVLVLSELHWADAVVLELLDHLLERLRNLPFAIVATARPEMEERWTPSTGRSNLVLLHLDPLRPDAITEMAAALLGHEPTPELRDLLLERSGGNPLFLEELIALLGQSVSPSELPATLRGLVSARLDALPARERSLLEDAAVVGRTGPVDAVVGLGEARGETGAGGLLDQLVGRELVGLDEGRFEFRSEVVREVAYETLTKAERARRHAALAEWLSSRTQSTGREDEHLERLAYHWGTAAELVIELGPVPGVAHDVRHTALKAIERAAVRARQQETPLVSLRLLNHALRLLPVSDAKDEVRVRVLLERAWANTKVRRLDEARADLDEVVALSDGDESALARALVIRGDILQKEDDFVASIATFDEAIERLRALDEPALLGSALRQRGMARLFTGEAEGPEADITEALALARKAGARQDEAWALWSLAWNAFAQGRVFESEQRLNEAAALFGEIGDWGALGWALGLLGYVRFFQGRREEAETLALAILDDARELGDKWALAMTLQLISGVRLWEGRTDEAVGPAREAAELFEALGDRRGYLQATGGLARVLAASGALAETRELLAGLSGADEAVATMMVAGALMHLGEAGEAMEALARSGQGVNMAGDMGRSEGLTLLGMALLQLGDVPHAMHELDHAASAAVAEGPRANALATLALAQAAGGEADEALVTARQVPDVVGFTYFDAALAELARGFAYAQLDRRDEAAQAFSHVTAAVDGTGDRLFQAVVRVAAGEALDDTGARADGEARLAAMGLGVPGWRQIFRLAASARGRGLGRSASGAR
jgi:class 3 adenylate cyclase/tetratricopeptide (TPR) repeat protein